MASPNGGTPVETGLVQRIGTGLRYAFSGKSGADFFGPGTALPAAAQEQAHGRQSDFPTNFNIATAPRGGEAVDFKTLRALADGYDLLRLAIETRKDQMGKLKWTVVKKSDATKPGKKGGKNTNQQDDTAKKIEEFLQEPDGEHDFLDWSRMLYEDLLTIDAPAIYIHPTMGGEVFALEQIDGATLTRKLDDRGRTPAPPAEGETFDPKIHTAYQQVIKGLPATNYHRDELIYRPRNPRVNKVYGYSPVEQIIVIVNLGLRRQAHQLAFYTAGNIPDMLMGTPATWTPEQIDKYQKLWNMMMLGDLEARRQLKFVPGDLKPLALRPETSLFDAFDEWLARVVCYCFNLPPNAFIKQQNRATAESAQAIALEEGLAPLMEWKLRFMNTLIRKAWKTTDYEFQWLDEDSQDPLVQAQIDQIYIESGVRLPNEVRDDHSWDAVPELDAKAMAPPPAPIAAVPPVDAKTDGTTDSKGGGKKKVAAAAAEAATKAVVPIMLKVDNMFGEQAEKTLRLVEAVGELRDLITTVQKRAPATPIPTAEQLAAALAKMVDSGVPLNAALKAVGYDFTVPGGDVALVSATRIPLTIAADESSLEPPPQPLAKRAPEPAPAPPIVITPTVIPAPTMEFNPTFHFAMPENKPGERLITMTKANGEEVSAIITTKSE